MQPLDYITAKDLCAPMAQSAASTSANAVSSAAAVKAMQLSLHSPEPGACGGRHDKNVSLSARQASICYPARLECCRGAI